MLSGHGWKIGRAVMNTHRLRPWLVYVGNGDEDEVALSIIAKHLRYVRRALLERGVETYNDGGCSFLTVFKESTSAKPKWNYGMSIAVHSFAYF
jgi:hypothetical protein